VTYQDVLYDKTDGIATVTINRPDVMNAFRSQTVDELVDAFKDAWGDRAIGAVIFTGAGSKAFCTGGDVATRSESGYAAERRARNDVGFDIDELHSVIRDIPKPVIAAVNGYAIGGGNVLQVLCDLTIAADTAKFGQVGPKVGSVDPGFGTAYLTHVVGEKKAREMWYLCEQYTAEQAVAMGLANKVVPAAKLMDEARAWAAKIVAMSPTALKIAKQSFNSETEHIRSTSALGITAVTLYYGSEEAMEGKRAFAERRKPDFRKFRV
jgi:2-ketocyclohexanecarboxyl-CoA hydrolase